MKIRIQKNDFGNIAMLPDGRVEVLNSQGLELVSSINDGIVEYSSKEIDKYIQYDLDIDLEKFHFSAPAIAFLELTNICNLTCRHCYAHSSPNGKRERELSDLEIKNLLDKWDEMGVLQVFLTGGEVFAHPSAIEIIKHARSKLFLTQIFTNGLLITEEHLKAIPKGTAFFVSFDSASNDFSIRGKMTYERLTILMNLMEKYGHVCRIAVNVHKKNLSEVSSIFKWCKSQNLPRPQWIETLPVGRARQFSDIVITSQETEDAYKVYEQSMRYYVSTPNNSQSTIQSVDTIKFCQRFEDAIQAEMSGRMMAYVNSQGDVFPSSNYASEGRCLAGNVRVNKFESIWSTGFDLVRTTNFSDFDCKNCEVAQKGVWCQFRCRSLSENIYGIPTKCGATEHLKKFMILSHDLEIKLNQSGERLFLI